MMRAVIDTWRALRRFVGQRAASGYEGDVVRRSRPVPTYSPGMGSSNWLALRYRADRRLLCPALLVVVVAACTEPVSWQTLLAAKIAQQYPGYQVRQTADGALLVERPGLAALPVDVNAIAQFCQRGPKDCNYATDRMLLDLRPR